MAAMRQLLVLTPQPSCCFLCVHRQKYKSSEWSFNKFCRKLSWMNTIALFLGLFWKNKISVMTISFCPLTYIEEKTMDLFSRFPLEGRSQKLSGTAENLPHLFNCFSSTTFCCISYRNAENSYWFLWILNTWTRLSQPTVWNKIFQSVHFVYIIWI